MHDSLRQSYVSKSSPIKLKVKCFLLEMKGYVAEAIESVVHT